MQDLIADLRARGLIQDITPGTEEQLRKETTAGYVGFDPTAASLHVGNLLPITLLMRLQRAGHRPVALVGGATGMIGDPSGKSAERNLLDEETLAQNIAGVESQLRRFLDFEGENAATLVNNYDWFKDFSFLRFIREVGKNLTVNYMLAKDSVKGRLENGISFTEFSYQLIQGYDFYHLYKHQGVRLQMGGADQWGNMTTGTELIRRLEHAQAGQATDNESAEGGAKQSAAFAFTCPLITKADGGKFGKTESGTIWLDAERTSPYQFYQFWLGLPDADAERMSYIFSFRPVAELKDLAAAHAEAPHQRALQKALAEEMTVMVHGRAELESALRASEILFGKSTVEALHSLNERELLSALAGVPRVEGAAAAMAEGIDLISFLADTGVFSSKGEARKLVQSGGLSINKEKVTTADARLTSQQLLAGRYVLIQRGKKDYTLAIFS